MPVVKPDVREVVEANAPSGGTSSDDDLIMLQKKMVFIPNSRVPSDIRRRFGLEGKPDLVTGANKYLRYQYKRLYKAAQEGNSKAF